MAADIRFLVDVQAVRGACTRGYKTGDRFIFNGFDTPDAFCGTAYTVLFPALTALRSGGRFENENNPRSRTGIACPDGGTVLFSVTVAD
jgi:uncharacterized repeat protein (TIGR04076 family)